MRHRVGNARVLVETGCETDRVGEMPVSYTHLRAHETVLDLVCRLLLEKKKQKTPYEPVLRTDSKTTHTQQLRYAHVRQRVL